MKRLFFILIICVLMVYFFSARKNVPFRITIIPQKPKVTLHTFTFTSIDTMKYSRDPSLQMLHDPSFDKTIDLQISEIAKTGATHVAIATPYDKEFIPFLKRWVTAARRHQLHVWFRGNFSGWEQWFGYGRIDRAAHLQKTEQFILQNSDLFENGDIFTPCSECENGGPGDPRQTGDVNGHRKFLIDEYTLTKSTFLKINKQVASNYDSMNADVARLIMDKETTRALDNVVVIDHYVSTPDRMVSDAVEIARQSGGKVTIGEFGVPIPSIHGEMTEQDQADWLNSALGKLIEVREIGGVNYWVSFGGSTKLWRDDGSSKPGVGVITKWFKENKKREIKNLSFGGSNL